VIIVLSERCPIFNPKAEHYLQSLLSTLIIKQRHILASPTPDRLRDLLPRSLWDIYGEYLSQSSKQAANSYQRWVQSGDCDACDAAKLAHFCDLPTVVVVENTATDGAWVEFIARRLRPRLARNMTGRYAALEFRQAGGIGEIPKELKRIVNRYRETLPTGTLPLRIVALADSDAITPGISSPNAREVNRVAALLGADVHVLRKRTIENYVPDSSLHLYGSHRPNYQTAIHFITSLTGSARDHYPLKTGLSEAEMDQTGSMYPPGTPVGLKMGDFIVDFIEDMGPRVDASELRGRDGVDELDGLLDLIEGNL
jgi:hypothetical protein